MMATPLRMAPCLRRKHHLVVTILVTISLVVPCHIGFASAFVPPTTRRTAPARDAQVPTILYGIAQRIPLIGRFRRKQEVTQVPQIKVGAPLPKDVDVIPTGSDGTPAQIQDILSSKSLIVGMPGAFTTTCTKEHLPGYRDSIKDFQKLGFGTIAVVTTNDRWVNQEWMDTVMGGGVPATIGGDADAETNSEKRPFVILSDADGDFVKSLGMAEDMGFGVGVRSKRFALAVEDGVVTHVLTDEGMDDCSATAAKAVLRAVSPKGVTVEDESGSIGGGAAILVGVAAVALAIYMGESSTFLRGDTSPAPYGSQSPITRVQTAPVTRGNKDSTEFSLLKNFKP